MKKMFCFHVPISFLKTIKINTWIRSKFNSCIDNFKLDDVEFERNFLIASGYTIEFIKNLTPKTINYLYFRTKNIS